MDSNLLKQLAEANSCTKEFVLCAKGHVVWMIRKFTDVCTMEKFELPEGKEASTAAYGFPRDNFSHSKLAKAVDTARRASSNIYGTLVCAPFKVAAKGKMSWADVKTQLMKISSERLMDMMADAKLAKADKEQLTPFQQRLLQIPAECKDFVHEVGLATACVIPA